MNATTTAEAAVLDLEPIERTAQPLTVQGTAQNYPSHPTAASTADSGMWGKRAG